MIFRRIRITTFAHHAHNRTQYTKTRLTKDVVVGELVDANAVETGAEVGAGTGAGTGDAVGAGTGTEVGTGVGDAEGIGHATPHWLSQSHEVGHEESPLVDVCAWHVWAAWACDPLFAV